MGAAGFDGSFAPIVQYEKWEIHPVFPHFPYFRLEQNLTPNLLVPLCGVAIKNAVFPPMSKRCIICISKTVGVPKVEDERRILLQIIESQAAQNAKLTEQVAALTAQVEELIRKLDEKNQGQSNMGII